MTDAFSVGRILSTKLKAFPTNTLDCQQKHKLGVLRDVSRKLTASNPNKRWSLEKAFKSMQNNAEPDTPIASGAHDSFMIGKQHGIMVPLQQ